MYLISVTHLAQKNFNLNTTSFFLKTFYKLLSERPFQVNLFNLKTFSRRFTSLTSVSFSDTYRCVALLLSKNACDRFPVSF